MKYFLIISLISLFSLASCTFSKDGKTKTLDSLDSILRQDSISKTNAPKKATSKWIIPLTDYWKDPEHFVLMIPHGSDGTDVFSTSQFNSQPRTVYDTLQGRLLSIKNLPDKPNSCNETTYYEVELGPDKIHGWVNSADVYVIGHLDAGTFTTRGQKLTFGEMKPFQSLFADDDCLLIRPIFFYDDSFLYLIDVGSLDLESEPELHWGDGKYVTMTGFASGISLQGQTVNNLFEINFGVPNGKATLRMEFNGEHVVHNFYHMEGVEGDDEEGVGDNLENAEEQDSVVKKKP